MMKVRFWIQIFISCVAIGWFASSCKQENKKMPEDFELATAWADLTNYITKNTPANTPTFASRCLGYI